MSENEQPGTAGAGIPAFVADTATMIIAPLGIAALIALSGTALLAQAAQRRLSSATDEGERQLELFSRSPNKTQQGDIAAAGERARRAWRAAWSG